MKRHHCPFRARHSRGDLSISEAEGGETAYPGVFPGYSKNNLLKRKQCASLAIDLRVVPREIRALRIIAEGTDERNARGTVVEPGSRGTISRGVPAYERAIMARPAWLGSCRRERDRISSSGTNGGRSKKGERRTSARFVARPGKRRKSLSLERLHVRGRNPAPPSLPPSLPPFPRLGPRGLILRVHAVLRGGTPGSGEYCCCCCCCCCCSLLPPPPPIPPPFPTIQRFGLDRSGKGGEGLWKLAGETGMVRCRG